MTSNRTQRRLAAILAADVVGYSRLMGQDEAGTLAELKALRVELIDPKVVEHAGRIFKTTGDGLLAEFPSVVNAVSCAVEIQRAIQLRNEGLPEEKAIRLRIGINLGDVIVENDDMFGDGVNVAARIESIASPGEIAISGTVRDHIGNRLDVQFDAIGEQTLKNIDQPVRVYRVRMGSSPAKAALALPDKPSIAVLPFQNMSGDAEQEYFADGVVEEIITALSRFRQLFVIARNSSFTYKGRAVDVKQVGRELGIRYVLEGSVRKSGSRVRITGQLIDAASGGHLWADRFEGNLDDIFDLQDHVTASVVGAIAPKLEQAEIERSNRKRTENLDAYDYYLRGLAAFNQWTKETNYEAETLFYKAIELDPLFAAAHGMAVRCYSQRKTGGWIINRDREIAETIRLARRASELGKDDALALSTAGIGLSFVVGNLDDGQALINRALALNPNLATTWLFSGWARIWSGDPDGAVERLTHALRLSPQDPQVFSMQTAMALAHFFAGRYTDASSWAETAMREQPNVLTTCCVAAASSAIAGQDAKAEKIVSHLRQLDPTLSISNLSNWFPFKAKEDFDKLAEGLRKAGLQE
jgi:TolB-like protein/Flp pilus assembly protein TadD